MVGSNNSSLEKIDKCNMLIEKVILTFLILII
jgi:hypothetical protein